MEKISKQSQVAAFKQGCSLHAGSLQKMIEWHKNYAVTKMDSLSNLQAMQKNTHTKRVRIRVCSTQTQSWRNCNADNACDSIGRLMEQSGNGLASKMPVMGRNAAGVMVDNPTLIPLVGNNSRFNILFTTKTLIYRLQWGGWEPAFSPSRATIQIPI